MNAKEMKNLFTESKKDKNSTAIKLVLKALQDQIPSGQEFVIFPASSFEKGDLEYLEKQGYDVEKSDHPYENGVKISIPY